jgi:hypothetical protein
MADDKLTQIKSKLQTLHSQLSLLLEVPQPGNLHLPLALLASIPQPQNTLVFPHALPSEYELNTLLRSKLPIEFDKRFEGSKKMEDIADVKMDVIQDLEFEEFKRAEIGVQAVVDEDFSQVLKWMASGE